MVCAVHLHIIRGDDTVASFMQQRGRVAMTELAAKSSQSIVLEEMADPQPWQRTWSN